MYDACYVQLPSQPRISTCLPKQAMQLSDTFWYKSHCNLVSSLYIC